MTLQYTGTTITSDATHHTASLLIPKENVWSVSWTPGMFQFHQAEAAMLLAEAVGELAPLDVAIQQGSAFGSLTMAASAAGA